MNECITPEKSFWNYYISQMHNKELIVIVSYNFNLDVVYFYYKFEKKFIYLVYPIIKQINFNKRNL